MVSATKKPTSAKETTKPTASKAPKAAEKKPAEKKPTEKKADPKPKAAEKPVEKPTAKPVEKPVENTSEKPTVKAKAAEKPKPKQKAKPKVVKKVANKKKRKQTVSFKIECKNPVEDGILKVATLEEFLKAKIKTKGKVGQLEQNGVRVAASKSAVTVTSDQELSKRYLKYLVKKFLKRNTLRDWLRVVATQKDTYELRYFQINQEDEGDAEEFRYGNYSQYYNKRQENKFEEDSRLKLLKSEWFRGRSVLDVGCNVGIFTIQLAKKFEPRRCVGIDIDPQLVGIARKNIRHYCDPSVKLAGDKIPQSTGNEEKKKFPDNLWFLCGNYILEDDDQLEMVLPEHDVILALSVSKWIHLNWGDAGLKRFFRRVHRQLRPNGRFILEPQELSGYRKRIVKDTEMKKHYDEIELKPNKFSDYLLEEVGFKSCENLGTPEAKSKGFQRPLFMFTK
ncbi:RNA methyltransferase [Aphelenchoides besseyi]|nr:RNA methyltransferase [Aphelenchoides besseyi]